MTTLDCADAEELGQFWADMLDGSIVHRSDTGVVILVGQSLLGATEVPDYQRPTWPAGALPKQIHLELAVDDLDKAEAEAVELGARRAADQSDPTRWRVFLDPAGHPFCLTTMFPKPQE
ncbi:VOC family protein [Antrihabitans cavernicola]|uniref:VOC family protein n=2 Tax=Antrihabitans cavernicola TaxID=2495913 RepID=A0A5A7SCT9_9NOCA|nr:VOC family protein [Spelaeibacter cavernicola]